MISISDEVVARGFEQVAFFEDATLGFAAIVGIHSTVLGPSLGGCRMNLYSSREAALVDVLRLAEGMTYKNSLAGLNIGGGKSVIIADRNVSGAKRRAIFESFGRYVASLNGSYITAEDMGTSVEDMNFVLTQCSFVAGRDPAVGGGGDPSPYTAQGVVCGMRAALEVAFGSDSFSGRHIAVQGTGHVGLHLVRMLTELGARVTVCDKNPEHAATVSKKFGAASVAPDAIYDVECDVFSPCAIGGTIQRETLKRLRTKIIAGAANNQLLTAEVEREIQARGILYAPDFAINAGGVILCADEREPGGFTPDRVNERVGRIYQTLRQIFERSKSSGELTGQIAVSLARKRIDANRASRK
ncbi:MAG: Glu/Leu/Phe/Val dehydrogenase dimerization domain-containing protein [Bdellovibrionota bacterium]